MYLKFGYFVLYTPIYRLTDRRHFYIFKTVDAEQKLWK